MSKKRRLRARHPVPAAEVNFRAVRLFRHSGRLLGAEERQVGGANPKETLVIGDLDQPDVMFIAKGARKWPRECVTEAMLSTIAKTLPISVAGFRLVRLPEDTRFAGLRFMSRVFLRPGEALVHGVELAAKWLDTDPEELLSVFALDDPNQERQFYSIETIVEVLRFIGRDESERTRLVTDFGKMVVFDAFVGVQDRHAQNWGIIECTVDPRRPLRMAPLYDTARGLFVSHAEEKLAEIDTKEKRGWAIARYAEGSKPIFGCRRAPTVNHFQLVEHMVNDMPAHFLRSARQIVGSIDLEKIVRQLESIYARVVTERRLRLVEELLRYRHRRMREIVFPRS